MAKCWFSSRYTILEGLIMLKWPIRKKWKNKKSFPQWNLKEDILNNDSIVFIHTLKVNGIQNNIKPQWFTLYRQRQRKLFKNVCEFKFLGGNYPFMDHQGILCLFEHFIQMISHLQTWFMTLSHENFFFMWYFFIITNAHVFCMNWK